MKNIAVLAGGISSERRISLKTSEQLCNSLDREKFNPYIIDISEAGWYLLYEQSQILIDKNDFSATINNKKLHFDFALIAIHGNLGEDGILQAYFEMMKIPYSGSNMLTSAICFNKNICKQMLIGHDINMAKSITIQKNQEINTEDIVNELGLPLFVKPNTAGSSFGVSKVTQPEQLNLAIENAFAEDNQIIIESFISGTEVSCGIFKSTNNTYVFPITEIDTKNEFFDFEAKYTPGVTDEITPARISDEMSDAVKTNALKIYTILKCKGIARIDFIINNNTPCFLEVNTVPGMSTESIVPQQIRAAGYTVSSILTELINDSFTE